MPLFSKRWKARAPDYGAEFLHASTGAQQTVTAAGLIQFPMATLSDVADTDKTKNHKAYIDEVFVFTMALAAGSGAINLIIKKRDAVAAATRILLTALDLRTLTALAGKRIAFDAGVTDKDRTMNPGDSLWAEVNCLGTVTTQPILTVGALLALLT